MRKILAILIGLIGLGIMLWGIGNALYELVGIYSHALGDPLSTPARTEQESSESILRFVLVGAAGLPLVIASSVMLKIGMIRGIHRRLLSRKTG